MQNMNHVIKRPYRSTTNPHTVSYIALIAITVAVAFGLFFARSAFANDSRLVTIHADSAEFSIRTDVETVGEAIEKSGVDVFEGDLVEPVVSTPIETDVFHVNVFRARSVTVIDGATKVNVLSAHQSPELVAEQAGLTVYEEDEYEYKRVDDFIGEGMVGLQLIIDRASEVSVDLFGQQSTVRTQANTVQEFIDANGVELDSSTTLTPVGDTKIQPGVAIRLVRTGKQLTTAEETVAFAIETINDSAKDIGTEEVKTAGVLGSKLVTYEVVLENGNEVGRTQLDSIVTKEPVNAVVIKGTKAVAPAVSSVSGTKEDWLRAAGIPEDQWTFVDFIVSRESGWNPNAVNPSSGACGLGQQLPCGKWAGAWNDPVAALQAQYGYVNARYGGYGGAYSFWQVNHWY